jgi:CheY-like chemotaxis protein
MMAASISEMNNQRIQIDEASNGKEAVAKFMSMMTHRCQNQNCPNAIYKLIIMDLQMPIMDGFDASHEILTLSARNQEILSNQQTNIVALTSYTDEQTRQRCFSIGMKEVLHKPLVQNELRRVIALYHLGLTNATFTSLIEAIEK